MAPKALTRQEYARLSLYLNCNYGLSPMEFRNRYDLSYAEIAALCQVSLSTVKRLFSRPPKPASPDLMRTLAIVDLLIRDEIPNNLIRQLCLSQPRKND